jgi:polysaccharide export outer membrane protein
MSRKLSRLIGLFLLLISVSVSSRAQTAGDTYKVGARDVLSVGVFGRAELSGKFTVSADGQLSLPLIGSVPVAGRTVSAIEADLVMRYADGYLRRPQITVQVAEYLSQRVFVIGEVRVPGAITLTGSTTLLEALAHAGVTEQAGGQVVLLRAGSKESVRGPVVPGQDGVNEIGRVSVQQLRTGSITVNVPLEDGDTIFVPRAETVFVLGQVNKPGPYTIEPGSTTVMTAISMAGGTTQLGSTGRVKVTRLVDGERVEERAKLDDVVKAGDTITVGSRLF